MKNKLTKDQEKELLGIEFDEFLNKFDGYGVDDNSGREDLTNFLLYKILKKLEEK